jgi:hypothetical protein
MPITPDDFKNNNPRLFWDGVGKGKFTYAQGGALQWGNPASPPLIEGILGGPHSPEYYLYDYGSTPEGGLTLGNSGQYPKPWTSSSQFITNANYGTFIGPYARFIGFTKGSGSGFVDDTCTDANNETSAAGVGSVWGRLGIAISGPEIGERAFFPQDWYNPSEGTFNAAYWNNWYNLNPPWQSRKDWWASTSKATIDATFGNTGLKCKVEVAYNTPLFGDPEYFAGVDAAIYNDFSLDLLVVMVGVAALTRWL